MNFAMESGGVIASNKVWKIYIKDSNFSENKAINKAGGVLYI